MQTKNAFLNIILLISILIVTLLGMELFTRAYLYPYKNDNFIQTHEKLGKFFIPGKKGWYAQKRFAQYIEINSKGLRDKEYSYEKPKKTYRILLLGDSFGAAFQVPLKNTFHSVFEEKLNNNQSIYNFEVINGSYPGWGTGRELEFYKYEGQKYSPDLVLLAFLTFNDILDNYYWEKDKQLKDVMSIKDKGQLKREISIIGKIKLCLTNNIRLYTYINKRLKEGAPEYVLKILERFRLIGDRPYSKNYIPVDYFIYGKKEVPEIIQGWQITKRLLISMKYLVEKNNSRFAVIVLPSREEAYEDFWEKTVETYSKMKKFHWNTNKPRRILNKFLKKNDIQFLDLLPYFINYNMKTGKNLHFLYDGHLNLEGHRLAGEIIFKWLDSQNIIPINDSEAFE